jgi:hypothetical protein
VVAQATRPYDLRPGRHHPGAVAPRLRQAGHRRRPAPKRLGGDRQELRRVRISTEPKCASILYRPTAQNDQSSLLNHAIEFGGFHCKRNWLVHVGRRDSKFGITKIRQELTKPAQV